MKIMILILYLLVIMLPADISALTITADSLTHHAKEDKYELVGNVVLKYKDAVIKSQRAVVYGASLDVIAEGMVFYEDKESFINAQRVELNMHTKTGELLRAVIFFKEGNYWIVSDNLKKISEDRYFAASARFTTCNPSVSDPVQYTYEKAQEERYDWCFKGREVDIEIGRNIRASHVSYNIKNTPVGYSPKVWAPINTERSSGLLMPSIGNSSQRGIRFAPAFFWAIGEDRDITFGLDYYSRRGLGKSLQFRYLEPQGKGELNIYHLHDRVMNDTQLQVTAQQHSRGDRFSEYVDINYARSLEMFKEYNYNNLDRTQRFLQSSAEAGIGFGNSRLFLLGQYWIDMKQSDSYVPQRLPELGYVLHPVRVGDFVFDMESSLSNFYSKEGLRAQRFDLMPTVSHAFGDAVRFYQSLSLRETAYNLHNSPEGTSTRHRETLSYKAEALSRFVRRYDAFEHIVEPSLQYLFIPDRYAMPVFDSVEEFNNISRVGISLLNLLRFRDSSLAARITQLYNTKETEGANPLGYTLFQGAFISKPFTLRLETSYDFDQNSLQTFYADLIFPVSDRLNIVLGERYSRQDNIMQYRTAIDTVLSKNWALGANVGYDAKGGGLRDSALNIKYTEQCWSVLFTITRRPRYNDENADYGLFVMMELKGIGGIGKR